MVPASRARSQLWTRQLRSLKSVRSARRVESQAMGGACGLATGRINSAKVVGDARLACVRTRLDEPAVALPVPSTSAVMVQLQGSPRMGSPSRPVLPISRPSSRRSSGMSAPPSTSRRQRRRQLLILALVVGVTFLLYSSRTPSAPSPASVVARAREHLSHAEREDCELFPWRPECGSNEPDPFLGAQIAEHDGHRFYDPAAAGPHPIHRIMSDAKRAWRKKVARQSTTLAEAVTEYERRYRRRPPKGFPAWFAFAQASGVTLVDEYDALHRRIEPYYALPSALLRARSERLQSDEGLWLNDKTFTVEVRHGRGQPVLRATGPMSKGVNERPEQMIEILTGIAKYLPEMNITFTVRPFPIPAKRC